MLSDDHFRFWAKAISYTMGLTISPKIFTLPAMSGMGKRRFIWGLVSSMLVTIFMAEVISGCSDSHLICPFP